MRREEQRQAGFIVLTSLEDRMPADHPLSSEIAEAFFEAIRAQAEAHKLLSREHFSVDGMLIEAAAALKRLRPLEVDTHSHVMPGMQGEGAEKIGAGPRAALAG